MIPRGLRNNNPGNLRLTTKKWEGEITGADKSFKVFATMGHGIKAIGTSIDKKRARGLNTIRKIIESYAPPVENDTEAYINAVCKVIGVKPDQVIDTADLNIKAPLVYAIISHENGQNPFTINKRLVCL